MGTKNGILRNQRERNPSSAVRLKSIDSGEAFIPDSTRGGILSDEAEALAEEFVAQATSAEDVGEDARDEFVSEEIGGPFLEVDARAVEAWAAAEQEEDQESSSTADA